jgi:heat shock protein HtpX
MQYTGIDRQIRKNNLNSVILLVLFPAVLLGMVYAFLFFVTEEGQDPNELFLQALPFVLLATGGWFLIAWGGQKGV